jgi:transposase
MKHFGRMLLAIEEGYYATEDGRVFSPHRKTFLKQHINDRGYLYVCLTANKASFWVRTHQFVWVCFNRQSAKELNHRDGNKLNNSLSNIEMTTREENIAHAMRTGLLVHLKGEECGPSKLTEKQVVQIKRLVAEGITLKKIGSRFGVHYTTISSIKRGITWTHIGG